MAQYVVRHIGQDWFRQWIFAYKATSFYMNQSRLIANFALEKKFQWNLSQNPKRFIQENAY